MYINKNVHGYMPMMRMKLRINFLLSVSSITRLIIQAITWVTIIEGTLKRLVLQVSGIGSIADYNVYLVITIFKKYIYVNETKICHSGGVVKDEPFPVFIEWKKFTKKAISTNISEGIAFKQFMLQWKNWQKRVINRVAFDIIILSWTA